MTLVVKQVAEEAQDDLLDLLSPGDAVMTTVTHEITVDGEKSWIKHGATTTVRSGETAEQARDRLSRYVSMSALKEVEQNVTKIREFVNGTKPF